MIIPLIEESWRKAYRIVSSRFPPIGVFDAIADPDELETLYWIEGLTNPRIRQEMGDLSLVKPEDRLSGDGTTAIMAAFTHVNPTGSRFSNGDYGVYYAANNQETAVAETLFHVERWAKESNDPATSFTMRVYIGRLNKRLYHDLRPLKQSYPEFYDPDPTNYAPTQQLAAKLRLEGSWGIIYHSVRHHGGECVAALRPPALGVVHQGTHLAYAWDGSRIVDVLELRSIGIPNG